MSLHVDMVSAYVICGAGSLVGMGMMLLPRADLPAARSALRAFIVAFGVLAVGLTQLGFTRLEDGTVGLPMLLAALVTLGASGFFSLGFTRLAQRRPQRWIAVSIGAQGLLLIGAFAASPRAFSLAFPTTAFATAALVAFAQRASWRGSAAERALLIAFVVYSASWLLRVSLTLDYDGPVRGDQAHMPAPLRAVFAMFYGTIPILMGSLVLNVVNAQLTARLRAAALTDELTGALTRRSLTDLAPALIERERGRGAQVATLIVDLDHFKDVNDRHGHAAGDAVLRRAAQLISANLRRDAIVTRYGGEEFVAVLPVADAREAHVVAERLRAVFEADACDVDGQPLRVTISAGISLLGADETLAEGLARADRALYAAKRGGRNRVEIGETA